MGKAFAEEHKLNLHNDLHNRERRGEALMDTSGDGKDLDPSKNYMMGMARFEVGVNDSEKMKMEAEVMKDGWSKVSGGAEKAAKKSPAKTVEKKLITSTSGNDGGSTMTDTDENMFILQNALQCIKEEPHSFEFEAVNGDDPFCDKIFRGN